MVVSVCLPQHSRKLLWPAAGGLWWPAAERIRMRPSAAEGESARLGERDVTAPLPYPTPRAFFEGGSTVQSGRNEVY